MVEGEGAEAEAREGNDYLLYYIVQCFDLRTAFALRSGYIFSRETSNITLQGKIRKFFIIPFYILF